jgi:3-deoxy-D-manno-octulosonic-acid transferase
LPMDELYVLSIYYTVTTISTVGYGDISGNNMLERIMCMIYMVSGVFFFSFASGSLTSVITQREIENVKHQDKLNLLNKIYKDHKMDSDLYYSVLNFIESHNKESQDVYDFVETLPISIRHKVNMVIHKKTYSKIEFLKFRSSNFISWICPLLKQMTY